MAEGRGAISPPLRVGRLTWYGVSPRVAKPDRLTVMDRPPRIGRSAAPGGLIRVATATQARPVTPGPHDRHRYRARARHRDEVGEVARSSSIRHRQRRRQRSLPVVAGSGFDQAPQRASAPESDEQATAGARLGKTRIGAGRVSAAMTSAASRVGRRPVADRPADRRGPQAEGQSSRGRSPGALGARLTRCPASSVDSAERGR